MLSFFSIFEIHNNRNGNVPQQDHVVNCFHFSVSLRYTTTGSFFNYISMELWIAFIFQYLWDTQQQSVIILQSNSRCELLSFFSIFEIHNNSPFFMASSVLVVNCFHFSVSLRYTTTFEGKWLESFGLWIAFIFQYLWDTQQQFKSVQMKRQSCELLSFFSIFEIHNNPPVTLAVDISVVNCFHFSVSLRYTTTG